MFFSFLTKLLHQLIVDCSMLLQFLLKLVDFLNKNNFSSSLSYAIPQLIALNDRDLLRSEDTVSSVYMLRDDDRRSSTSDNSHGQSQTRSSSRQTSNSSDVGRGSKSTNEEKADHKLSSKYQSNDQKSKVNYRNLYLKDSSDKKSSSSRSGKERVSARDKYIGKKDPPKKNISEFDAINQSLSDRYILSKSKRLSEKSFLEQIKEKGRVREQFVGGTDDRMAQIEKREGVQEYIHLLSVEQSIVLTKKLKWLGFLTVFSLVFMLLLGYFLNKNNPVLYMMQNVTNPLVIKFIDENGVKLFNVVRSPGSLISQNEISPYFKNAFISLHGLIELIYQRREIDAKKRGLSIQQLAVNQEYINNIIQDYSEYINAPQLSLYVPDNWWSKFLEYPNHLFSTPSILPVDVDDDGNILIKSDNYVRNEVMQLNDCIIFRYKSHMSNYGCKYSTVRIIMSNYYSDAQTDNLLRYLAPVKYMLLVRWLETKISLEDFLELFLNITYYGNYQVGLKSSYYTYFSRPPLISTMDVPYALFMIYNMYQNNKNIYPNYNITIENILDLMIINGQVPALLKPKILKKIDDLYLRTVDNNVSYAIYLDKLFAEGYKFFPDYYSIVVQTTFSSRIYNLAASYLTSYLKSRNIPSASIIVIRNSDLLMGMSANLINDKLVYNSDYPKTYVYNSLKPFMYLALLSSKKDIDITLLGNKYQNIIFSNKLLSVDDANQPEVALDSTDLSIDELANLSQNDLDIMPSGIKKKLADHLVLLEKTFLNQIDAKQYKAVLSKFNLVHQGDKISLDLLLSGDLQVSVEDIANAYSIFSNKYDFTDYRIINNVNNTFFYSYPEKAFSVRDSYSSFLRDIYFSNLRSKTGKEYYVITDLQSITAFNDEYVVVVWLGSFINSQQYKDSSKYAADIMDYMLSILK